jgi:hypothetical protein
MKTRRKAHNLYLDSRLTDGIIKSLADGESLSLLVETLLKGYSNQATKARYNRNRVLLDAEYRIECHMREYAEKLAGLEKKLDDLQKIVIKTITNRR